VTGIVGSGKTMLLHRLLSELEREGKVLVSKLLSVDEDPDHPADTHRGAILRSVAGQGAADLHAR
jgi:type II secretory pathway predicted ATPase ExeA